MPLMVDSTPGLGTAGRWAGEWADDTARCVFAPAAAADGASSSSEPTAAQPAALARNTATTTFTQKRRNIKQSSPERCGAV